VCKYSFRYIWNFHKIWPYEYLFDDWLARSEKILLCRCCNHLFHWLKTKSTISEPIRNLGGGNKLDLDVDSFAGLELTRRRHHLKRFHQRVKWNWLWPGIARLTSSLHLNKTIQQISSQRIWQHILFLDTRSGPISGTKYRKLAHLIISLRMLYFG